MDFTDRNTRYMPILPSRGRMSLNEPTERVDLAALEQHLSEAIESAEDESTKYHVREAYQKIVFFENRE